MKAGDTGGLAATDGCAEDVVGRSLPVIVRLQVSVGMDENQARFDVRPDGGESLPG